MRALGSFILDMVNNQAHWASCSSCDVTYNVNVTYKVQQTPTQTRDPHVLVLSLVLKYVFMRKVFGVATVDSTQLHKVSMWPVLKGDLHNIYDCKFDSLLFTWKILIFHVRLYISEYPL